MEEFFAEAAVTNSKSLCIGPITKDEAVNEADAEFCTGVGYYLYAIDQRDPSAPPEVLARLVSDEAARRLAVLLKASGVR